ncbi:unnamed protein product [Mytilus coruscus]|uniref:ISXO2-like transposase domain-containing protein n=1 Tax=Mytilus coruscus TaxID=42192 RepID=A0A6J8AZR2_MYTCO|nr:unnamed protein product [Mytilus coruscus]
MSLFNYIGNGPLWGFDEVDRLPCERFWWHNLLYINNFQTLQDQCLGWTWYLANDMQFYVISPILLLPLYRSKVAGSVIAIAGILGTTILTRIISFNFDLGISPDTSNGSWFQGHNLSLEKILFITYFWIYKIDQEFVKHELSICNQTIVDWYNYCREVCIDILKIDSEKIGGDSVIVEIDESKFGKRKYHKGRQEEGQWVFGGTTIISDCWKAYDCLVSEGFEHLKVNHSVNFVDPETGAHTNTIESTWRALKKSLPKYGTVKSLYDTYFSQYCVRKKYITGSEDLFIAFITLIKQVYNPVKQKQTLITTEIITISEPQPATKKPRVLHEITNTLSSSLDDFQA